MDYKAWVHQRQLSSDEFIDELAKVPTEERFNLIAGIISKKIVSDHRKTIDRLLVMRNKHFTIPK